MSYQTIDVVKPIVDFIKTCPFMDEFNIDMKQIDTQTFSSDKPPGTALEYVGSVLTGDLNDVLGLRETRRQANFQLWLLRKSNTNLDRTETVNFLFNFEHWIEYCQYNNLIPHIGDLPDYEIMWADNGMFFSEWEEKKTSQYMVQLHIQYNKVYEEGT